MIGIVKDCVGCRCERVACGGVATEIWTLVAGIEVAVEAGKIAARDFETQSVAFFEDVAGGPEVDREFVDFAGRDERRMFLRFSMAGADDAFGEVLREAVGPDVDEFRSEVGVGCG